MDLKKALKYLELTNFKPNIDAENGLSNAWENYLMFLEEMTSKRRKQKEIYEFTKKLEFKYKKVQAWKRLIDEKKKYYPCSDCGKFTKKEHHHCPECGKIMTTKIKKMDDVEVEKHFCNKCSHEDIEIKK